VPWAAYERPCRSPAGACPTAVAWSDCFWCLRLIKAVNKILRKIQAAGLLPRGVRHRLAPCCPPALEALRAGSASPGVGPALLPAPSGWDQGLLLSPGLGDFCSLRLRPPLSAPGTCVGVTASEPRQRASSCLCAPSAATGPESGSVLAKVCKIGQRGRENATAGLLLQN